MKGIFYFPFFFILGLLSATNSTVLKAQDGMQLYQIDSNLKFRDCVELSLDTLKNSVSCAYLEIQKFENDSIYYNSRYQIELYTKLSNDSLVIRCVIGPPLTFGAIIVGDSALIVANTFELFLDKPLPESGNIILSSNQIPTKEKELTLSKKIMFRKGEIFQGVLDFQSKDFWLMKKEDDQVDRLKLKAYIRVRIE